jgi:succinoglycan biosynthesis protein ExoM
MLGRALDGVTCQATEGKFSLEVVVVDNDSMRSAQAVVEQFMARKGENVIYDCEPEQNIAKARNRAVQRASGDFIAFIDDDEYPVKDWLTRMHGCLLQYNADAVLGPVLPDFPPGSPAWLKKSGLCERNRNKTGSFITKSDMRTGNILLQRRIFEEDNRWFDPSRGRTGGEDGEFIGRQIRKGKRFIWCDESVVFETVPPERWQARFYLNKSFRIGSVVGAARRKSKSIGSAIRPSILLICYLLLVPLSFLGGKHIWMKMLTKLSYNTGLLSSYLGLASAREREMQ